MVGIIHRNKAREAGVEPMASSGSDTSPVRNDMAGKEAMGYGAGDLEHVVIDDMSDPHTRLHRGLKARQVTMIAIGGAM